jgi:3-hydroxybutyryl-CoA dehydrogenase
VDINNVFVVGAGFMGSGIAQVAAMAGSRVRMNDVERERLETGMTEIERSLGKLLSKEKIDGTQRSTALANISVTTELEDASDADLVVEAVPENLELKKELFGKLDAICQERAILATNTSAISITAIGSATGRPDRVVGAHFFGPVPLMRLCEVIKGVMTSEETFQVTEAWARSIGKETVLVRRDIAGFIANRVTIPGSLEAVRMVDQGLAAPEEIDSAATFGIKGVPGPLQIIDNAGIEVSYSASMAIYEDTGEPRFYPPPIMRRLISAKLLGRKSGRGFYDYSTGKRAPYDVAGAVRGAEAADGQSAERSGAIMKRVMLPMILESVRLVEAGVALPADIDKAARLGFNFPMGPLELACNMGLGSVLESADELFTLTGNHNFFAPALLRDMVKRGQTTFVA